MDGLLGELAIAAGSIAGREHARLHRNNQDGVALHVEPDLLVAAVADGCSSGRSTEVGARLGAAWLATWTARHVRRVREESLPDVVADGLADYLAGVTRGLCPPGSSAPGTIAELMLFTFLVAVLTRERTCVFGMGDGVWSINGRTTVLDPGPDNAPAYIAYRLVEPEALDASRIAGAGACDAAPIEALTRPALHHRGPTSEVETLAIGTDGVADLIARAADPLRDGTTQGGLAQFEQDDRWVANPSLLQKRLVVIGELNGHLPDDTTLVMIRRRTGGRSA
jgi:hypothetical protein